MFSRLFKQKRSKDGEYFVDDICSSMSYFLIDDNDSEYETPFKSYLHSEKLDYSLESLHYVDKYLDQVRKKRKSMTQEELLRVIARCGSYAGEVIKRNSKITFAWMKYDDLVASSSLLKDYEKSPLIYYILTSDNGRNMSFPLAKVEKYLAFGKQESLHSFAMVVGNFT